MNESFVAFVYAQSDKIIAQLGAANAEEAIAILRARQVQEVRA